MKTIKILLILFVLIFLVAPIASVSPTVVPLIIVLLLAFFSGTDPHRPRLVMWIPFIWGLAVFESLIVCIHYFFELKLFPPEMEEMLDFPQAIYGLIFIPILLWSYYKKRTLLPRLLIVFTAGSLAFYIKTFFTSPSNAKTWIEFISSSATEIIVLIYMLKKFPTTNFSKSSD